ncbi:ras association domain-containing protein 7-like [Sinocyclocheilus anshuiensis]|uniref:Ras association domain-containing protein 7-like n=1 Tax=Sinocyclocheilus anshuiensis TaxID=1608454 RepID=A0A671MFE0_9TELE|nr:PREDICTED: ras association domain-containing protein 7-like [Sinocyclocheilus anshuiensis]XP_016350738.1 PREDICTED: ras association domain-containing protein 7-like [Sinocyclocheilus anshuiensis]XP_016350740.1 PREDICTED: ras association domain-containing protein 7-like [Sinocyclocheilus anshuiensis]
MELKVWVEGIQRVVCGLSEETSCQDVVIALAQAIGQTGRYVLIQKLRDKERQLVANERPLESLAKLGQLGNEVQFILRRTGPTSSEGSDQGRAPKLPRPPDPEPLKHKEPKKALTFNLGPSTSPQTRVKQVEKPLRDSQAREVSPSPPLSLAQAGPSKDTLYQQILRQQGQLQSLQGQQEAQERELGIWERAPPPTLSPDFLEEMDHLQQLLRRNESELAHVLHWENEFQSEVQREKDMLRQKNKLHLTLDKHSRRLHDTDNQSEQLERDIKLLFETKRNGVLQARPSVEESVVIAKEQLDNHQRQGAELQASNEEIEKELRLAEEQLQAKSKELDDLNKELRQCNLQQFILQTGVTPAQSNQQTEEIDFALLKPDGQSDEDSNSSILEFNPGTTAKQILGNPRSLQNPLVSSLHPEVLSSRETSWR